MRRSDHPLDDILHERMWSGRPQPRWPAPGTQYEADREPHIPSMSFRPVRRVL